MPTYNFKKETKVYVVRSGIRYLLDVYPDLTFSQTFNETNVPVKTLHSQFDMFEDAVITRANPANFSFTMPLLLQADLNIVLELLMDYDATSSEATLKSADLYIESNSEVYKLEKAVFEAGTFQMVKDSPLTVSVSGTASRLSKFTGAIPGVLQSRSVTRSYTVISALAVAVNAVSQPYITGVTVELKNDVRWIDFATIHDSIGISDASGTQYAEAFVVGSRVLSGTIQQYVTDETNSNVNTWRTGSPISIQVGTTQAWNLEFAIPSTVFTNRVEVQDLYVQSYDFRMTSNPTLATVIKKRNI